jgi:heterodisulfide reductase subunit B
LRLALFPGCAAQTELYGCELSVREVFPRLGVELVDLEGSSCCGFLSFRLSSPIGWKYLTARNLALAEKLGLDVITLCSGCHLSFCEVKRDLDDDAELRKTIDETLSIEGLEYNGESVVQHVLEVLHDQVGLDQITDSVTRPLNQLKLAAHPGCRAFRPKDLGRPDDTKDPRKLEELIQALGAESPDYQEKLDCCGSSTYLTYEEASLKIAGTKLKAVRDRGFDGLVTVCPHCFKLFDGKQAEMRSLTGGEMVGLPVFYYTQLLGLSMGIEPKRLGLHLNLSPVEGILERA